MLKTHARFGLLALALGSGLLASALLNASANAGTTENNAAITVNELREHLFLLASDEYEGRGAGLAGGIKAGDYLAKEMKRLGLKGGGDQGSYFQNYTVKGKKLRNVVAYLPGSDLKDEVVVLGAHYDHLGFGAYGSLTFSKQKAIHNGADDNASGTTTVLEVAERLALGAKPRRTVVFIWFDGEELGLTGSKHYCKNPRFPMSSTVAMINLDMVGRLKDSPLVVYGENTGSTFKSLVKSANKASKLSFDSKDYMTNNSDHFSFYDKKVPTIAFFTGLHSDYHRPSDDAQKIDYKGMKRIADLTAGLLSSLADADTKPEYKKAKPMGMRGMFEQMQKMFGGDKDALRRFLRQGRSGRRGDRGGRPRFGVSVTALDDQDGTEISRVSPGSVAAKAGVQEGDRIVQFGARKITDFNSLRAAVQKASGQVDVVVLRSGQRKTLKAQFGGVKKAAAKATKKKKLY